MYILETNSITPLSILTNVETCYSYPLSIEHPFSLNPCNPLKILVPPSLSDGIPFRYVHIHCRMY